MKYIPLFCLPPGSGFAVPGTALRGRLLESVLDSHARVEFTNGDGKTHVQCWSAGTEVMVDAEALDTLGLAREVEHQQVRTRLRSLRPAKEPRPCGCGCGGTTKGGRFLPGHDSKFHAAQKRTN